MRMPNAKDAKFAYHPDKKRQTHTHIQLSWPYCAFAHNALQLRSLNVTEDLFNEVALTTVKSRYCWPLTATWVYDIGRNYPKRSKIGTFKIIE